ncbi:MAG TPA: hypothetical protein VGH28_03940 [Polyangiaceae bacterium]|jgi:hypothetical protein
MTKLSSVLVLVGACGFSRHAPAPATTAASTTAAPAQSLADAVRLVCDATTRASNDPAFRQAQDPAAKAPILGHHLKDGVTNERVLATIDAWTNKTNDAKRAELDALTKEAGLTTCSLRQIWEAN